MTCVRGTHLATHAVGCMSNVDSVKQALRQFEASIAARPGSTLGENEQHFIDALAEGVSIDDVVRVWRSVQRSAGIGGVDAARGSFNTL